MDTLTVERLLQKPGRVICPVCRYTEYTVCIRENDASQEDGFNTGILHSLGSAIRRSLSVRKGVHYCANCGLRLAKFNGTNTSVLAAKDDLLPPSRQSSLITEDGDLPPYEAQSAPVCSPLGRLTTANPATFGKLKMQQLRQIKPQNMFKLAWDPITVVPTTIYNELHTHRLFEVLMPALVDNTGRVPKNYFPFLNHYDDPSTDSNPHLLVSKSPTASDPPASDPLPSRHARLYKRNWNVGIYASPGDPAAALGDGSPERHATGTMRKAEHEIRWTSASGPLTWRWPGTSGMRANAGLPVCFDAYERPVAADLGNFAQSKVYVGFRHGARPALRGAPLVVNGREPPDHGVGADGRVAEGGLTRLALYVDCGDELLLDILVMYVALQMQMYRYYDYAKEMGIFPDLKCRPG